MPTWPATIPQKPDFGGWTLQPQSNSLSFEPEVGPPITRRRASSVNDIYDAKFTLRSDAERAAFLTFFRTTLIDGTLAFDWNDPITAVSGSWKIIGKPPFRLGSPAFAKYELSLQLIRLS